MWWCAVYRCAGGVNYPRAVELVHDLEQLDGRGDIVFIVYQRNLCRLPHCLVRLQDDHMSTTRASWQESKTNRKVDDTPDPALAVPLEHAPDLGGIAEIACVGINDGALLVLLRRVRREAVACYLCDTFKGARVRVVVVVNGDHLEPPCLLEGKDDMRRCKEISEGKRGILRVRAGAGCTHRCNLLPR